MGEGGVMEERYKTDDNTHAFPFHASDSEGITHHLKIHYDPNKRSVNDVVKEGEDWILGIMTFCPGRDVRRVVGEERMIEYMWENMKRK